MNNELRGSESSHISMNRTVDEVLLWANNLNTNIRKCFYYGCYNRLQSMIKYIHI